MQDKKTLLVIGYVWPEPRSSAAGGHMMQLLHAFLAQGWSITFASPAGVGEHKADLASLGIAEQAIELNNGSFDVFIKGLNPGVVLFDRFMMEEQFGWRVEKHCPNALRVLETSDLQCLRGARETLLKAHLKGHAGDDFSAWFSAAQAPELTDVAQTDLCMRELAAIYRSDLSLIISEVEIDWLQRQFNVPAALLHWCPLLVNSAEAGGPDFHDREHMLSIGNFRHAPNWDAVLWLKQAVWPRIRARLPRAQLHVYGAYTPPKATALHNAAEGFLVKGWAPDALHVMRGARLALAPLRFGAGIKGKLVDAMQCGTPSITTPIGAEGMHGDSAWPGAVANSAEALASAAAALYQNETPWREAQRAGYQLLSARYESTTHADALIDRVEALLGPLQRHRLANITGQLLRHHHHKSTQYMAQWIEEKNRHK